MGKAARRSAAEHKPDGGPTRLGAGVICIDGFVRNVRSTHQIPSPWSESAPANRRRAARNGQQAASHDMAKATASQLDKRCCMCASQQISRQAGLKMPRLGLRENVMSGWGLEMLRRSAVAVAA